MRGIATAAALLFVLTHAQVSGVALARAAAVAAQPQAQAQAQADSPDAHLAAARKLFDALDYERALVELDRAVAMLEPRRNEAAARDALEDALELRARTQFGLGTTDRAREDFHALIVLAPDYRLGEGVSPRVIGLFNQIRAQLVGQLALTLEPADAQVVLDGRPVVLTGEPLDVVGGEHTLNVTRGGYKPAAVNVSVEAGRATEWRVTLERASATLSLQTLPSGVEVSINGASRGRTADAPPEPGASPPDPSRVRASAPFVIGDLAPGTYTIELRKPCHEVVSRRITIEQLTDYRVEPLALAPAVGSIQVGTSRAAQIFLDGQAVGDAPRTVERVCEGVHTIEARTRVGRDIRRIEVHAGERASLTLVPRPVIALLAGAGAVDGASAAALLGGGAATGAPDPNAPNAPSQRSATAPRAGATADGGADLRIRVQQALTKASNVLVYAPPVADVRRIEQQERAPSAWLAFDVAGKPLAPGVRQLSPEYRRDLSARLAKALDVQGIAAIVRTGPITPGATALRGSVSATGASGVGAGGTGGGASGVWLAILAAGASDPDLIELPLDRPDEAVRALDEGTITTSLLRRNLGLSLIDVLQRSGPLVLDASPAAAGVAAGDTLTHVNSEPVATEQDVRRLLEGLGPVDTVTLRLQSRAGTSRDVSVPVSREPRLVTLAADSGLANVTLLELRTRLPETTGLDATAINLNIAGALMRTGQWAAALEQLQTIRLADGPGFSNGSVQYLIGLCHEALGRAADAQRAFAAAAKAPGAILSEDGPLVSDLVARRARRQ